MSRTEITITKLLVAVMVAVGLTWVYLASHTVNVAPTIPCELQQVQHDFPQQCAGFVK